MMKKTASLVLALLLCLVIPFSVFAAETAPTTPPVNTALFLGTWEVDMPNYGLFTMKIGNDGTGEAFLGEKPMGNFTFMAQGDTMVSAEDGEDGKPTVEQMKVEFVDENTIKGQEDGTEMVFKRTAPPQNPEVAFDNPFIGTWEASIPSAGAVLTFEFRVDGGFLVTMGEQVMGPFAYLVRGEGLYTFEEGVKSYTFAVRDENTIDVTEDGVTVPFVKVVK